MKKNKFLGPRAIVKFLLYYVTIFVCLPMIKAQDNMTNGHEYVDLGLSVKWATCNVGASSPTEYGDYFAWGEISSKNNYTIENNVMGVEHMDGNPKYDAATANWGATWRLPTRAEVNELFEKCKREWTTQDGCNGLMITGPNGNSIFLPASGAYNGASLDGMGEYGLYWSAPFRNDDLNGAHALSFNANRSFRLSEKPYKGCSIRPVITDPESYVTASSDKYKHVTTSYSGSVDGHQYVDLGLRVNWATCNIGADTPTEFGNYFKWSISEEAPSRIGGVKRFDIASAEWGGVWRMPSMGEINELFDKCKREWVTLNGHSGFVLTGPNGNSIFLPAASELIKGDRSMEDKNGDYWSCSADEFSNEEFAYGIHFYDKGLQWYNKRREYRLTVRPVFLGHTETKGVVNGHEYVDLGLGVKWATCNVGASSPEDGGSFFAWGETKEKSSYKADNSATYNDGKIKNIANQRTRDAATANWGAPWRMPTTKEIDDLVLKCKWRCVDDKHYDTIGYIITGPNGNSIFLPTVGYRNGIKPEADGCAYYWSCTSPTDHKNESAYILRYGDATRFYYEGFDLFTSLRYYGLPVRPVLDW